MSLEDRRHTFVTVVFLQRESVSSLKPQRVSVDPGILVEALPPGARASKAAACTVREPQGAGNFGASGSRRCASQHEQEFSQLVPVHEDFLVVALGMPERGPLRCQRSFLHRRLHRKSFGSSAALPLCGTAASIVSTLGV